MNNGKNLHLPSLLEHGICHSTQMNVFSNPKRTNKIASDRQMIDYRWTDRQTDS